MAGKEIVGVNEVMSTRIFEGNVWGLVWLASEGFKKGAKIHSLAFGIVFDLSLDILKAIFLDRLRVAWPFQPAGQ